MIGFVKKTKKTENSINLSKKTYNFYCPRDQIAITLIGADCQPGSKFPLPSLVQIANQSLISLIINLRTLLVELIRKGEWRIV